MSASAPAGIASRNTGAVVAACTSATMSGVGASEVMSQPAPTSCIHEPMFETIEALHNMRNTRWRSGAHAPPVETCCSLSLTRTCRSIDAGMKWRRAHACGAAPGHDYIIVKLGGGIECLGAPADNRRRPAGTAARSPTHPNSLLVWCLLLFGCVCLLLCFVLFLLLCFFVVFFVLCRLFFFLFCV